MSTDSQTAIANRHDFDKTFTAEYDNNQTGATLITPASGKLLKIVSWFITSDGGSGYVRLYFSDDENDQINTVGMIKTGTPSIPHSSQCLIRGDRDAVLKFDSTLGDSVLFFILINYKEE